MPSREVTLPLVFLVVVGALSLGFKPGVYLNDEIAQAAALDCLARGHIWMSGDLPGYASLIDTPPVFGNVTIYGHWAIPAPGGHRGPPVASTMLNVLALPVLGILWLLGMVFGASIVVALPAFAAAALGLRALLRWFGVGVRVQVLAILGAAVLFWPVSAQRMPQTPLFELSAIILVSMFSTGIAAAFLFDLIRSVASKQAAIASTLAFLVTPISFWGLTGKYSSLSVALVVLALWCYRQGARSSPLRTALAFAMGGLAVWNQLPWGVFLLACLGVALLGAFRLGLRPAFARVGAAALGFVVGVLPEILTRVLLSQAGVDTQYGPGTASGLWGYITSQLQPGGMLARSVFTHPWDPLYSAYRGFVWTHWVEEHWALSFLCIVPLTGVAVAALFRPRAIPVGFRPQLAMGLTYVVVVLAVMGKQFVDIGGGPDMRYGLTFWPILALLWTPGIAETVATRGLRWFTGLALWVALGVVLLTAALNLGTHAAHRLVTVHGIFYDQTAVIRYGGFVLAGLLGALFLFRGIRVSWKDQLVAGAIGFAGAAQILVLTISTNSGIFVAWPAGVGLSGLYWILMGDWPPYRP